MRKVLVFGGTRYFGKRLVELLLKNGDDVTIATRGTTVDDFGERVKRVIVDRASRESIADAFADSTVWDVIYDNICYSPVEAKSAIETFSGKVKKYVLTSTMSVYKPGEKILTEEDFNPQTYPYKLISSDDVDYGEGKRMAEAVLFQEADFPVAAVRFPIVLGIDDYTKRLHFHINHIQNGKEIGFTSLEPKKCFITSEETAEFLFWIGKNDVTGPYNACSNGDIQLKEIIRQIESETGKKAIIIQDRDNENSSPFGIPDNWYMSNRKAQEAGFVFKNLHDWFPRLVHEIVNEE